MSSERLDWLGVKEREKRIRSRRWKGIRLRTRDRPRPPRDRDRGDAVLQKLPRETEREKSLENGAARCPLPSLICPSDVETETDDNCDGRVGERVNGVALLRRLRALGFMFRIEGDAVQVRGGNPGADKAAALAFLRENKAAVLCRRCARRWTRS